MILQLLNTTIGYATKNTLLIDSKKEELFRLCNLQQHCNQEQFYNYIYTNVYNILKKHPELVHTSNATGYTILHCICTSTSLLNHIQLIQLVIYTSEYVTQNSTAITKKSTKSKTKTTATGPTITTYLLSKMMNSPLSIQLQQQNQQQKSISFESETESLSLSATTVPTTTTKATVVHVLKDNSIIVPSSARLLRDVTLLHGMNCLHLLLLSNAMSFVHTTTIQFIIQSYPECVHKYDYIHCNLPIHTACSSIYKYFTTTTTTTTTTKVTSKSTTTNVTNTTSRLNIIQLLVEQYPDSCCKPNKDGNVPLHLLVASTSTTGTSTRTGTSSGNGTGSNTKTQSSGKSIFKVQTIIEEEDNTSTTFDDTQSSSIDIDDDFDLYTKDTTNELDCTDPYMMEFINKSSSSLSSSSYDNTTDDDTTACSTGAESMVPTTSIHATKTIIKDDISLLTTQTLQNISIDSITNSTNFSDSDSYCNSTNEINDNYTIDLIKIIQYMIDSNPLALLICNNNGYTPYEVALVEYNNSINNCETCTDNNNINHKLQIVQLLANATTKAKSTCDSNNRSSTNNNNKRAISQRNNNIGNNNRNTDNQNRQDIDLSIHFTKTHSSRMIDGTTASTDLYQESLLTDCWTNNTMEDSSHHNHFAVVSRDNLLDVASTGSQQNINNNNNYDWNADTLHARLAVWNRENTICTETRIVEAVGDNVQCTTTSCNRRSSSSFARNQLVISSDDTDSDDEFRC